MIAQRQFLNQGVSIVRSGFNTKVHSVKFFLAASCLCVAYIKAKRHAQLTVSSGLLHAYCSKVLIRKGAVTGNAYDHKPNEVLKLPHQVSVMQS